MELPPEGRVSARVVAVLVATKLAIHVPMLERYGYHRDELYFIACGRHLDFGYVDHAPLVPWLARLTEALFGEHLWALRLPSLIAGALSVALTVVLTARFGGRGTAQALAGLSVIAAPAFLRMGKMLCIPVFEPVFWTGCALVLVRLIRTREPRLWLAAGALAGAGLVNKHTMLLWGAGVAVGVVLTPLRAHLRTPWPWAGAGVALAFFAPNLLWQASHDWATVEFLRNIRSGMLAEIPRHLFVLGQLVYMNPVAVLVWGAGLVFLFGERGRPFRVFAWLFLTVFVVLLSTHAKPYYLAPAFPPLLAAGGVLLEAKLLAAGRRVALAALALASVFGVALSLPVLSLERSERLIGALLGAVVPPIALTHDLHDEYGWTEQANTVARVHASLPPEERASTIVLTGNYGEASAVNFYGARTDLPRAWSGHVTYHLWGPPPEAASVVIAYGLRRDVLESLFTSVVEAARTSHLLAHPHEHDLPVWICRGPRRSLKDAWPELKRYGHGMPDLR